MDLFFLKMWLKSNIYFRIKGTLKVDEGEK